MARTDPRLLRIADLGDVPLEDLAVVKDALDAEFGKFGLRVRFTSIQPRGRPPRAPASIAERLAEAEQELRDAAEMDGLPVTDALTNQVCRQHHLERDLLTDHLNRNPEWRWHRDDHVWTCG